MSARRCDPVLWLQLRTTALGYWVRPFDTLADRRRWRWQKAQRCGLPDGTPPEMMDALQRAVHVAMARRAGRCEVPPVGWWCSRTPGHDGPCAARSLTEEPPLSPTSGQGPASPTGGN